MLATARRHPVAAADDQHPAFVVEGATWWMAHCLRCSTYLGDEPTEPAPDLLCLTCEEDLAS